MVRDAEVELMRLGMMIRAQARGLKQMSLTFQTQIGLTMANTLISALAGSLRCDGGRCEGDAHTSQSRVINSGMNTEGRLRS